MPAFYFPILFLRPADEFSSVSRPPFHLARRKWTTSTFDLATLATKHKLHLPYQLMDVLLAHCNLELEVEADDIDQAKESLSSIMLGMYLSGISPTIAPFATTHSINDYSGINSRDSDSLRGQLPTEQQHGLTSSTGKLEAWPVSLSMQCRMNRAGALVSEWQFQQAATKAAKWLEIEASHRALRIVRDAAQAAPTLMPVEQALLHVWCALEALFPKVSSEVSFRVALYLAQLSAPVAEQFAYFDRVRRAYNLRSRVAHGSETSIGDSEWLDAWTLLLDAGNSIILRGRLPTEDDLLQEILAAPAGAV